MKKVLRFLDRYLEETLGITLLILMTAIITAQVIFRYCSIQVPWTEEIARYMFVWMIYLGCTAAIKYRKHLKIDAVQLLFNDKVNFVLDIISNVVFFIFCLLLIVNGTDLLHKIGFIQHQVSPAAKIPMIIPYSSWYICSIIMLFRLVQDTILRFKERKEIVANQKLEAGKGEA
ncbi:MAG: TRAP transporter small permease [Firmicutes bacterium]|nr:TRAP transporter small permease [Bacillota bacterium]